MNTKTDEELGEAIAILIYALAKAIIKRPPSDKRPMTTKHLGQLARTTIQEILK